MLVLTITALISFILLINFETTLQNHWALFETYKKKYHRVYKDPKSEQKGFFNFVNNVNIVTDLNNHSPGNNTTFALNKYADLDPADVKEHFNIEIQPYENTFTYPEKKAARAQTSKFLEDMNLYDLTKVEDLYRDWNKKWKKENYTKKVDRIAHFYRFIKTVAELNKKKYAGEDVTLGPDADKINEPDKYFYG